MLKKFNTFFIISFFEFMYLVYQLEDIVCFLMELLMNIIVSTNKVKPYHIMMFQIELSPKLKRQTLFRIRYL